MLTCGFVVHGYCQSVVLGFDLDHGAACVGGLSGQCGHWVLLLVRTHHHLHVLMGLHVVQAQVSPQVSHAQQVQQLLHQKELCLQGLNLNSDYLHLINFNQKKVTLLIILYASLHQGWLRSNRIGESA